MTKSSASEVKIRSTCLQFEIDFFECTKYSHQNNVLHFLTLAAGFAVVLDLRTASVLFSLSLSLSLSLFLSGLEQIKARLQGFKWYIKA